MSKPKERTLTEDEQIQLRHCLQRADELVEEFEKLPWDLLLNTTLGYSKTCAEQVQHLISQTQTWGLTLFKESEHSV